MPVDILIADDHPIIITGVRAMLQGTDYRVVEAVRTGDAVHGAIERTAPDIVILDEQIPGAKGLDLFGELRARGDARPVILLTAGVGDQRALNAIDSGINGIVLKHTAADNLLQCLDAVRRGERWIDQGLLQRALDRARGKEERSGLFDTLTSREHEVVQLVSENLRNPAIAARLGLSEGTVKVHLHNIYRKLNLTNRTDLMLLVRDMQ